MMKKWLERLRAYIGTGDRRFDIGVLLVLSVSVYLAQAVAWPLYMGRDFRSYLTYYVQYFDRHPAYPLVMTYRTPLTPFFIGLLNALGGPVLLEVSMGICYCLAILAIYVAGRTWSLGVGRLASLATLACPAYGALFHFLSSDALFAFGFALWIAFVCRTALNPRLRVFAWHGIWVFVLTMIRPAGQLFVPLFFCFPFLLRGLSLRDKALRAVLFLGVACALLNVWSVHNYLRYDDFTISRGGAAFMPLNKLFIHLKCVSPANGPVSREFADIVSQRLLTQEPYKSRGIDVEAFFSSGSSRMFSDLKCLCDDVYGWDADYKPMRKMAIEAIRTHPVLCARRSLLDVWRIFTEWGAHPNVNLKASSSSLLVVGEDTADSRVMLEKRLMNSDTNQVIPLTYREWKSYQSPEQRTKIVEFARRMDQTGLFLPRRNGVEYLCRAFDMVSATYPVPLCWLALGLFGTVFCHHSMRPTLWFVVSLSLLSVIISVLGINVIFQYRVPFDPVFILFGVTGFVRFGLHNAGQPRDKM